MVCTSCLWLPSREQLLSFGGLLTLWCDPCYAWFHRMAYSSGVASSVVVQERCSRPVRGSWTSKLGYVYALSLDWPCSAWGRLFFCAPGNSSWYLLQEFWSLFLIPLDLKGQFVHSGLMPCLLAVSKSSSYLWACMLHIAWGPRLQLTRYTIGPVTLAIHYWLCWHCLVFLDGSTG